MKTISLSMTWAMYHLHRHPVSLSRLLMELDQCGEDPAQLASAEYLKACVQETLRIHPIVTEVVLESNSHCSDRSLPFQLDMQFRPSRSWLTTTRKLLSSPKRLSPSDFWKSPTRRFVTCLFRGGHRRCVGAAFATYEMAMVLGTLLKRFSFQLLESSEVVPVRKNVTMCLVRLVPLTIKRR